MLPYIIMNLPRDAFGSLDQSYLIRTMLEVGINKDYCILIADIYQESHFQVICGNELSKEYLLTVGTKTGCLLSVVLFVIQLDRSLKEVHNHAIFSLNIQDEKRISLIPVGGYADDIAFIRGKCWGIDGVRYEDYKDNF